MASLSATVTAAEAAAEATTMPPGPPPAARLNRTVKVSVGSLRLSSAVVTVMSWAAALAWVKVRVPLAAPLRSAAVTPSTAHRTLAGKPSSGARLKVTLKVTASPSASSVSTGGVMRKLRCAMRKVTVNATRPRPPTTASPPPAPTSTPVNEAVRVPLPRLMSSVNKLRTFSAPVVRPAGMVRRPVAAGGVPSPTLSPLPPTPPGGGLSPPALMRHSTCKSPPLARSRVKVTTPVSPSKMSASAVAAVTVTVSSSATRNAPLPMTVAAPAVAAVAARVAVRVAWLTSSSVKVSTIVPLDSSAAMVSSLAGLAV